jgi:hypothetical protein
MIGMGVTSVSLAGSGISRRCVAFSRQGWITVNWIEAAKSHYDAFLADITCYGNSFLHPADRYIVERFAVWARVGHLPQRVMSVIGSRLNIIDCSTIWIVAPHLPGFPNAMPISLD